MTKFQILVKLEGPAWHARGTEEAHNAEAAVKASYMKDSSGGVTQIVAVPFRSWKPTRIRTETMTKIVLGEEKPEA